MRWLILLFPFFSLAQGDAKLLVTKAYNRFAQIQSYVADIQMRFDIPGINMEPLSGKVYYKKPEKFRIYTKGIFFLPRQNPYFALQTVRDTQEFNAFLSGEEKVGETTCKIVNVIPSKADNDLILAKLWIDEQRFLVHKAQLTTRQNGTIIMEQTFLKNASNDALPQHIRFVIDMVKFKVPKAMTLELNAKSSKQEKSNAQREVGEIHLSFSNYKINVVVSDTVFAETNRRL